MKGYWMHISREQDGFTLLEMLIATLLAGLLLTGLLQVWQVGTRNWLRVEKQVDTAEGIQMALDRMVYEIREAREINAPAPGGGDASQLQFTSCRTGSKVTYYASTGWLYRKAGCCSATPIAEKVKELRISSYADDGDSIEPRRVAITIVGNGGGRYPDPVFQTSVRLQVDPPTGDGP